VYKAAVRPKEALTILVARARKVPPTTYALIAVAIIASAPAWIVQYPPMVDVPFHLAAIRVIHSIHDPSFGLDEHFVLTLGRTQYIVYYIAGSVLSYLLGVVKANVVLMCCYLTGTVLAVRALCRALGKDERLCLLVIPLLNNVMFMYGLFPFLVGIPLMFWALASAIHYQESPTLRRGILLGVLTLSLFYTHIFPFGLFGLGFAFMFPWSEPKRWLKAGAPTLPALLVLAWWTTFTTAGKLVRGALTDSKNDPKKPLDAAIGDIHNWLTNVFRDTSDEFVTIVLGVVVLLAIGLAQGSAEPNVKPITRRYAVLPVACIYLYFTSAEGHGYIWLIAQRFPIMFAMLLIPLLPHPSGIRGHVTAAASLVLALGATVNTAYHFIRFQKEEVGAFDVALAQMEPKKKVCALMYSPQSSIVNINSFMHFGSYYQVQKGGVVQFTYAGYAHWPFDFQPGRYPPPGGPARLRWEWTPQQVPVHGEIYPYYDYVLTRGRGFRPPPNTYREKWTNGPWAVWEKIEGG
jgi:hypothetical protein